MKHFTYLFAAAFSLTALQVQAQSAVNKNLSGFQMPRLSKILTNRQHQSATKENLQQKVRAARAKVAAKAASPDLWIASHEAEYSFNNDWVFNGDYFYTFNPQGKILTNTFRNASGDAFSKVTNEYNEAGSLLSSLQQSSSDNVTYSNVSKQVKTYDEQVPTFATSKTTYVWDDAANDWTLYADEETENTKVTVTRDDHGNVTSVITLKYTDGDYTESEKQYFTYDYAQSPYPIAYQYYAIEEDYSTGEAEMDESLSMHDMQWKQCDGQLVNPWTAWIGGGTNLLEHAAITYAGMDMGSIDGTYTDKGYTITLDLYPMSLLGSMGYKEIDATTFTDENGSYETGVQIFYDVNSDGECTDDELYENHKIVDQYDAHLNETLYEEYYNDFYGGTQQDLGAGEKYEYTYDEEHGALVGMIYSVFSPLYDEEGYLNGGSYKKAAKYVGDNLVNATTGITNVATTSTAPTAIYDLKGIKQHADFNALAPGIYLIQANGKTEKVIKK